MTFVVNIYAKAKSCNFMSFHGFDALTCDFLTNPSLKTYKGKHYTQKVSPQCVYECVL